MVFRAVVKAFSDVVIIVVIVFGASLAADDFQCR